VQQLELDQADAEVDLNQHVRICLAQFCLYLHVIKLISMTAEEKLDIIKVNIKHLVDYYDDNNIMDTIPDYVWKYILEIEKHSN
jgi:hypothetical protein